MTMRDLVFERNDESGRLQTREFHACGLVWSAAVDRPHDDEEDEEEDDEDELERSQVKVQLTLHSEIRSETNVELFLLKGPACPFHLRPALRRISFHRRCMESESFPLHFTATQARDIHRADTLSLRMGLLHTNPGPMTRSFTTSTQASVMMDMEDDSSSDDGGSEELDHDARMNINEYDEYGVGNSSHPSTRHDEASFVLPPPPALDASAHPSTSHIAAPTTSPSTSMLTAPSPHSFHSHAAQHNVVGTSAMSGAVGSASSTDPAAAPSTASNVNGNHGGGMSVWPEERGRSMDPMFHEVEVDHEDVEDEEYDSSSESENETENGSYTYVG